MYVCSSFKRQSNHTCRTEAFEDTTDGQTNRGSFIWFHATNQCVNKSELLQPRQSIYMNIFVTPRLRVLWNSASLLFAEEGMGSPYIGLPSLLVSKRGHKYVKLWEEGVPRNSDIRQFMYGNYVYEHKAACHKVALLRWRADGKYNELVYTALLSAQSFMNARYRDLARG